MTKELEVALNPAEIATAAGRGRSTFHHTSCFIVDLDSAAPVFGLVRLQIETDDF